MWWVACKVEECKMMIDNPIVVENRIEETTKKINNYVYKQRNGLHLDFKCFSILYNSCIQKFSQLNLFSLLFHR